MQLIFLEVVGVIVVAHCSGTDGLGSPCALVCRSGALMSIIVACRYLCQCFHSYSNRGNYLIFEAGYNVQVLFCIVPPQLLTIIVLVKLPLNMYPGVEQAIVG